jgi:hypothetical protein
MKTKTNSKKNNDNQSMRVRQNPIEILDNINEIIEPILIESDHDDSSFSRSSSDEDFIVSSDEETSSSTDNENRNNRDLEILTTYPKTIPKPLKSLIPQSLSIPQPASNLSSLSKLLLLNGTPLPSFTTPPLTSNKSPLIPIQPKPTSGTDIYQVIIK